MTEPEWQMTTVCSATDMLKALKGHVPMLLRHPSGAAVVDAAFTAASAAQRNAMAVEFYGRELSLFAVRTKFALSCMVLNCFSCRTLVNSTSAACQTRFYLLTLPQYCDSNLPECKQTCVDEYPRLQWRSWLVTEVALAAEAGRSAGDTGPGFGRG
jgi:hypothetical protein